jgi:hypothetical protein
VGQELAAWLNACNIEDCMVILNVCSDRKHLRSYPNNALIYTFNQQSLKRPEINEVHIGWASIKAELDSLDHFKLGMGYGKKLVGQRIELHRFLRPFCRGPLLRFGIKLYERRSQQDTFNKLAGMLRWYAEEQAIQ